MANIKHYEFGRVTVDDVIYGRDLIIYPDKVETSWWRDVNHLVQLKDLQNVFNTPLQILIIGTGPSNEMKIADSVKEACDSKGIKLITENTEKACKIYNELKTQNIKIVIALHLS
ncbi:MAG: Mth938-like domain-containing protein [bacterium]|nr:Mth938-like domain-containing protein [bacterium]